MVHLKEHSLSNSSKPRSPFPRALYMAPVWIVALGTSAKSFVGNPVIGSRLLNSLGLHTIRVLLARAITWFRWLVLSPLVPRDLRRAIHADGFAIMPNFVDEDEIKALRSEIKLHQDETRQMVQGNTATQRILLDNASLANKPHLSTLCGDKRFLRPLKYASAKLSPPLLYVQRIRNGFREAGTDPQKTMHADTFHPTMKAWLFLEDVTPEKGPFTYVKGSHKLTPARLKWEYQRSRAAARNPDGYSEKGSFRASPDDLKAMHLPDPSGACVKAGTLVIANTNGFHGRGQSADNQSRLEIWAYSRPSPFNPLPGLPFNFIGEIQSAILKAYWRRKDRIAKARNSRASWHLIEPSEMTDFD